MSSTTQPSTPTDSPHPTPEGSVAPGDAGTAFTGPQPSPPEMQVAAAGAEERSEDAALFDADQADPIDQETAESGKADSLLPPFFDPRTSWDQDTKRTALVVMLVAGVIIFWISRPVLPVLILAFIISYLMSPMVDLLERIRIPRGISTVVLYLLLLLALILSPILFVPVLVDQLRAFQVPDVTRTAQNFIFNIQTWVNNWPTQVSILGLDINIAGFVSEVQATISGEIVQFVPSTRDILEYINRLVTTATNLVGGTAVLGITLVGGIFNVFLFLLFLFFMSLWMTKDAPVIRNYIAGLFPRSYQGEAVELIRQMSHIWQSFFRGQLILCIIIGLVTWGALRLIGMPGALILGIIAGVLEVIPNIGPVMATIPAVIVALIQGSTILEVNNLTFALLTVGVYFVIQQLENQILVPRIIGTSVNLHPIVVLSGVVVGASLGGILGALLAAPVIASLRVVGSYVHAKMLDNPPFLNQRLLAESQRRPPIYRRVIKPSDEAEKEPAQATPSSERRSAETRTGGSLGSSVSQ